MEMTEQEILKQAWICSNIIDNSYAKSVFTMGEREALKFAHVIQIAALQRAVEICATHPIPEYYTEENGGDGGYNDALSDCADAIEKEMEEIGDAVPVRPKNAIKIFRGYSRKFSKEDK